MRQDGLLLVTLCLQPLLLWGCSLLFLVVVASVEYVLVVPCVLLVLPQLVVCAAVPTRVSVFVVCARTLAACAPVLPIAPFEVVLFPVVCIPALAV